MGVQNNIVESAWCQDGDGKYVYFTLARYPEKMLFEVRRLSKGSKVVASLGFLRFKICFAVTDTHKGALTGLSSRHNMKILRSHPTERFYAAY